MSDFQLVSWVLIENGTQLRVSQYAAEVAKNEEVRQFAERMVQTHQDFSRRLNQPLRDKLAQYRSQAVSPDDEFEVSEILTEIAEQLEQANPAPAGRRPTTDIGVRENDAATDRRDAEEQETTNRSSSARSRRSTADEAGDDNRDLQQAREDLREERRDLRQQRQATLADRDDALRNALPVLREALPDFLEAVGRSLDGTETERVGVAFLTFKRDVAERYTASITQELKQSRGQHFGQTYLGFQVAMHIRLIDSMQEAKKHASPQLARILEDGIDEAQQHLTKARQLMHDIDPDA